MESKSVYIPMDRCQAIVKGTDLPNRTYGAALFADISGFTPLTEALLKAYGPRRGPEELTRQLNRIFDALVAEVHRYGGSVIALNGDAITCWLDGDDGLRAIACGLAMQQTMDQFAALKIPTRGTVSLAMKAAVATGPVRRFLVGDPQIQYIDVLAGATLDRMAAAEHQAKKGEVVVGPEVMAHIGDKVELVEWRHEHETDERFSVVGRLSDQGQAQVETAPWPAFAPESLIESQMRPWLLPPVYERLQAGKGEFLAELRPAVVLFLSFGGIDYDGDETAGAKLDGYIRWVQTVLARYEGYLLQLTVGDKGSYLYTAFGAPIAHEDDAMRAVSAALELRTPPTTLNFIDKVQIGISQGQIYTGAYGGTMRRTYGVMGDDVNLAARLMQAAAPEQVLVSYTAKHATADTFTWENLPPLKVKGKTEPVSVFSLGGVKERRAIHLQEPNYVLPMVGREIELALIEQKLAQVLAGHGQIIGITAEAGMGKSRLVAEVIHIANDRQMVGYGGECQSYGTNISYLVWQAIWRGFFGLDPAKEAPEQVSELERQLKLIDPALAQRLPLLGAALNLSIPDNDLTRSFDAKLRKASLEALLVDCMRARAKKMPLLLILEDCHWLDPLSHDLLEEIGRTIVDLPVLLVLAYRPPELQRLQAVRVSQLAYFTEIRLADFTPQEAERLITLKLRQFFGAQTEILHEFVEYIIARAQGNPFYIEELLNYLQDQGFDPSNSEALKGLDLPTSLYSLILSRIDRLNESQKSMVKVASIIGRLFKAAWLWGVYPELGEPAGIKADLEALSHLDLTPLDTPEPELTYLFKHVITQEVAYESLPYATRAALHEQLAWFIERAYSQTIEQYVDLLAFHYERSQNEAKKREYLRKAGEAAQANYANEAAISYYQKALTLWETDTDTAQMARPFEVYEGLGEMLVSQERYAEAIETFTTMRVAAEAAGETRMQARAWHGLSTVQRNQGDHRAVLESAIQVEAAARAAGANVELAMALLMKGRSLVILGDVEAALALGEQVLALTTEIGAQAQMARSLSLLGWVHGASGRYAQSDDCFARALAICEELDDRVQEMDLLNNLGVNAEARGDYRTAFARYQEALRIAQEIGYRDGALVFQNNLGMALVRMGEYQAAEIDLRQVIYRAETTGSGGLSDAYSFLAEACLGQGKVNEALSAARQALVLGQDNEDQLSIAAAWRALGKVASHLPTPIVIEDEHGGQLGVYEAAACFAESIRICTETGMEGERARTLQAWATHELERGDRVQGEAMWQEARQLFAQLEADLEVERMAALPSSLIMTE